MSSTPQHYSIPMISTTPPPIDDNDDDIDGDDFDAFTGAFPPETDIETRKWSATHDGVKEKDFETIKVIKIDSDENKKEIEEDGMKKELVKEEESEERNETRNCEIKINISCDKSEASDSISLDLPENNNVDNISCKSIEFFETSTPLVSSNDVSPDRTENATPKDEDSKEEQDFLDEDDFADFEDHLSKIENVNKSEMIEIEHDKSSDEERVKDDKSSDEERVQDETCIPEINLTVPPEKSDSNSPECQNQIKSDNKVDSKQSLTKSVEVEEEFSDFADFSSFNFDNKNEDKTKDDFKTTESAVIVNDVGEDNINADIIDDEFADFASAEPSQVTQVKTIQADSNECKSSIDPIDHQSSNDESEFADFASFSNEPQHLPPQTYPVITQFNSTCISDKVDLIVKNTFGQVNDINEDEDVKSVIISKDLFSHVQSNSIDVWEKVQNLEEARSLRIRWSDSHAFQMLLKSLKIDPRNILRNSSVPLFASGLGLLEPTMMVADANVLDINSDSNSLSSPKRSSCDSNANTVASIPPVQFDWGSSGLTNPLDENQKLDLDFFDSNDDVKQNNSTTTNSNAFTNLNLEQEFLSQPNMSDLTQDSEPSSAPTSDSSNIFQQLLSTIQTSASSLTSTSSNLVRSNNTNISSEAIQILDELPNLSFMRAKVLMFPMKSEMMNINK